MRNSLVTLSDLSPIFRFLDVQQPEVVGRESQPPPPAIRQKIARFVQGELNEAERLAVLEELRRGPSGWISWFAEQIKAATEPGESRPG